jgi:hypothetical protein
MPDTDLGHRVTELPPSRQHFRVDEEPFRLGEQLLECFLSENLQRAIAILDLSPEQSTSQKVIAPRKEAPLPGILTVDSVADRQLIFLGQRKEIGQIG